MSLIKPILLFNMMLSLSAPVATNIASTTYTPEIELTSPLEDILENDRLKTKFNNGDFQKAASSDANNPEGIYPMQMTEWHFGYSDYGLYFYVWNQTQYEGFSLNSYLNGVTIQNVTTGSYNLYPIKFISRTNYQFFKYKIDIPDLNINTFLLEDGSRSYSLGQLHLKKANSGNGLATSYPFGSQYTYSGSIDTEDLAMTMKTSEVLNVEVTGGTFRTSSADEGLESSGATYDATMAHNDLHYVYFNIPNSYLNEYGDVAGYHFTYHPILLNPIVTLKGSEVSNNSIINTTNPNDYDENYYARYQWLKYNNTNYVHNQYNDYGFIPYKDQKSLIWDSSRVGDILALIFSGGLYAARHIEHLAGESVPLFMFHYSCISEDFQAIALGDDPLGEISSQEMDNYISLNNLEEWADLYFDGHTYTSFEELWNASLVEEHLRYDQENYVLKSYDKFNHSKAENTWRNKQNGYEVGEDVIIHPIDEITSSNVSTDQERYCLENNSDMIDDFHANYLQAIANNETPYIFRFCQTQSIIESLWYDGIGNENDFFFYGTRTAGYPVRAGSLFVGYGIYDLVSLDLTFTKNGQETIIPISADPINLNPPVDSGQDPVTENPLETFWNTIKQFLMIALIFIAVIFIIWLILKIYGWWNKASSKKNK